MKWNGWNPIESAPKDGTRVLLWDNNMLILAWWDKDSLLWTIFDCDDPFYTVHANSPTHWMPLPEGP